MADGKAPMTDDEQRLVARLRAGDEAAFLQLARAHHMGMLRVARLYVHSAAAAEDAVQDAWMAALAGLPSFEGRSSFKTWLFRILANQARARGVRDKRYVPLPDDGAQPTVPPERFNARGMWQTPPTSWPDPESLLANKQLQAVIEAVVATLPEGQRAVVTLQDIEDLDSEEVCALLDISDGSRRVQLHRARARIRAAIETFSNEASSC